MPPGVEEVEQISVPPASASASAPANVEMIPVPQPTESDIPPDDIADREPTPTADIDFPQIEPVEDKLSGSGSSKQNKANLVAIEPVKESPVKRRNIQVVEVEVHAPMNKPSPRSALRYIEPVSTCITTPRVGASPTEGVEHGERQHVDSITSIKKSEDMDLVSSEGQSETGSEISSEKGSKAEGQDDDGTESIGGMLGEIFRSVKAKFNDPKKDSDASESTSEHSEGRKKRGRGSRKKTEEEHSDAEEGVTTRRRSSRLKSLEKAANNNSENNLGNERRTKRGKKSKWDVPSEETSNVVNAASTDSPNALPLRTASGEFSTPASDSTTLPLKVKDRWRRWSEQDVGHPHSGNSEPNTPPVSTNAKSPLEKFKEKMMSPEKLSSEPPVTAKSPLQKFKEGLMNQDKNPSLGITPILESVAKSPLQKYKENNTPSSTSDQELVGKSPLQKFKESLSGIKLEADPKQLRSPDKALSSLENVKVNSVSSFLFK